MSLEHEQLEKLVGMVQGSFWSWQELDAPNIQSQAGSVAQTSKEWKTEIGWKVIALLLGRQLEWHQCEEKETLDVNDTVGCGTGSSHCTWFFLSLKLSSGQ